MRHLLNGSITFYMCVLKMKFQVGGLRNAKIIDFRFFLMKKIGQIFDFI